MNLSQEFLELLAKHKELEDEMKQLAWEITPDNIKQLLSGKGGLFKENNRDVALRWLIEPHWQFDQKSPTEMIIGKKNDKVERLLAVLIHGIYI